MIKKATDHMKAAIVGVFLGLFLVGQWVLISNYFHFGPPAFEGAVLVPDHTIGQNPYIDYTRIVRENMRGEWTVEIQWHEPGNGWIEMCQGGSSANYTVDEKREIEMLLSVYAGIDVTDCINMSGEYRLISSWKMIKVNGSTVQGFWHVSESFIVSDS